MPTKQKRIRQQAIVAAKMESHIGMLPWINKKAKELADEALQACGEDIEETVCWEVAYHRAGGILSDLRRSPRPSDLRRRPRPHLEPISKEDD